MTSRTTSASSSRTRRVISSPQIGLRWCEVAVECCRSARPGRPRAPCRAAASSAPGSAPGTATRARSCAGSEERAHVGESVEEHVDLVGGVVERGRCAHRGGEPETARAAGRRSGGRRAPRCRASRGTGRRRGRGRRRRRTRRARRGPRPVRHRAGGRRRCSRRPSRSGASSARSCACTASIPTPSR